MTGIALTEALLTLHGAGPILETAREVSRLLREAGLEGGIIGGVATVLHGHVRTTLDVDVFVSGPTEAVGEALRRHGFVFDAAERAFVKGGVPVHLVTIQQTMSPPRHYEEIDAVRVVSLADLINLKLRSGLANLLRAQDLADVIGLIRARALGGDFAAKVDPALRAEFRRLADAVRAEP